MPSIYIETYGCQMNVADTELMRGHLTRSGYTHAEDPEQADVILLNTCAIRDHAEERIFGRLGTLSHHKVRRPHVQIGLAGCMAQHFRDQLLDRTPYLDFVVGPDAYRRLPALLSGDPFVDVRLDREETYADLAPQREAGIRAWITIMRGCDKFCTFCIVPYVRGRERSMPVETILEQVRDATEQGFREVVFLGQTVNAYREGTTGFGDLLRQADTADGLVRIRFTSPHPSDMAADVIDAMASCDKVCPHLHLPVQSGSTAVLDRMERGYTTDDYLRLVERIRSAIPDIALTTDIIVGFPGETEVDFQETLSLVEEVQFDDAFTFKYSVREGTPAVKIRDHVDPEVQTERMGRLVALVRRVVRQRNIGLVGTTHEVLVERPARRGDLLQCRTRTNKIALVQGPAEWIGTYRQVRFTGTTGSTFTAWPLEQPAWA
jgi:tRNA-2-methylthio-N6-dimethylallyladenosine synthase